MKYFLFRHGETHFSKSCLPYGSEQFTAQILESGKPAVKNLASYLKLQNLDAFYCSELLRCIETAKIVESITSLGFITNSLFNEFLEEDFDLFNQRIIKSADFLRNLGLQKIALCTHGANVAGLRKVLLGKSFMPHDLMYYPKTGVIIEISDNEKELDFNS